MELKPTQPTDRQLLEWAARAAGILIRPGYSFQTAMFFVDVPNPDGKVTGREWNPLTDDGDALRLAVKLKFDLILYEPWQQVAACRHDGIHHAEPWGDDLNAATRRAIFRAAAALGRASAAGEQG